MALLDSVGAKTHKTMGFALIVAFLSLGVISGCGSSNNDSYDFADSGQSDGGLDAVDPNAGIYPNIQVIEPFLSGAIDPIKVQYWDQTYYWGPDSDGNDACFKGTVGIEDSSSLAQETAPGPECPTSLGQVTPCNPAAAADTVASGAVQPAVSGCERDGAACTDILVPDITDEVMCESTVRQADPIAAGAAWFQNIDAPGTKGGTASHWWYGTRADKTFDAEDGYGGTQIDYISDATNINIAASGGGRGPTTRVNNIYLCSNKDVVNPAESPDVCTLSSLFGSCGYAASGDPAACKINNIGLVDGAYNVFIRSATPSEGFGGGNPDDGSNTFTPDSNYVMITFDDSYGRPGDAYDAVQSIVGAGAHMTYFATAAFTGDFSTFDEWVNTHGNEVANHTVSHIDLSGEPEGSITGVIQGKITPRTKQQWSDADLGYTAVRWKIEIRDMASILANWSNIDSSTIRGFRAPKLQLNVYTFTGYADYIKQSGVASNNYYDSSLSYPRGGVPVASPKDLEPPKKLTAANYCTSKFNIVATNSSELDQCEQILDYGDQVIWEIPMPILPGAQGVMTLPNCEDVACTTPQVFEKFIDEWLETSKTPLLISIHSDELIRDGKGWFAPWVKEHMLAKDIKFVSVGTVVDMYANQQEAPPVVPPIPTPGKYGDCAVDGSSQSSGYGFASSSPTGAGGLGQYPYCNLDCDDQDYGKNCYRWGNTPGKTGRFITYNYSNNCTPAAAPQGFVNGAYPWLGNPMGNTTTGSLCNTFPDVINPPPPVAPVCINKRDASGNYPPFTKGDTTITLNTCVMYNTETYRCNVSAAQAANCYSYPPGTAAGVAWEKVNK